MLITAPIMCVGGIFMAIHQDAGLSWLLLVSVPVLAVANYWIVSHMLPMFRGMQRLIDGINRVMREQLSGVRVVRAFAREPFERDRFAEANLALSNTALSAGDWQALMLPVTTLVINVSSVALIWFGGLRIDARPDAGRFADRVPVLLHADPDGRADGDDDLVVLPRASVCAERITEVLSTDARDHQPADPRSPGGDHGRGPAGRRDVQLSRAPTALCCKIFR